jgi:hypothetical protein
MVNPQDNIQVTFDKDQAGAQTMLAFKVEHSKVPEFFGQKNKDTITAIIFIRRINDLARTNNCVAPMWQKPLGALLETGFSPL